MSTNQILIDLIFPKYNENKIELARNIVLVVSFSILTALCAQIKVEIGAVPITFQTFAVLLSGTLLGRIKGSLSQLTYILLGLAGFPLFARGGGLQYLLSPTFGYIIGFVFAAFFVGKLAERGWDRHLKTSIFMMAIGNLIVYIFGLIWLVRFVPYNDVLKVGLYPFLLGDMMKIVLASLFTPSIWKIIKKFKGQSSNSI